MWLVSSMSMITLSFSLLFFTRLLACLFLCVGGYVLYESNNAFARCDWSCCGEIVIATWMKSIPSVLNAIEQRNMVIIFRHVASYERIYRSRIVVDLLGDPWRYSNESKFSKLYVTTKHLDLKLYACSRSHWSLIFLQNNRQRDDHPCAMYNYVCYSHNNFLDGLWCIKKVSLLHFVILQDIKSTLLYGFVQCNSSVNNLGLTAWFFHLSFSRLISIKDIIVAIESSWWNRLLIVFVGHFLDGDLDQTEIRKTSFGVRENTMSWWCYSRTRIESCHLDSQIRGCIFVR